MYNREGARPLTGWRNALTEVSATLFIVAALFFLVAAAYSSVGLGGGSSYVALLSIFGFGTAVIPLVSLALNLLVTSVASYNFIRQRHALPRLIVPFLLTSLPMAYLGGALQVPVAVFHWVLLLSLCLVAVRIYFWKETAFKVRAGRVGGLAIALFSGAVLGLAAGVVGIGGGIFLVPLIIVLGLGSEKQAAACGAIFVWLTSLAGLIARLQYHAVDWVDYAPLYVAVILGAALGSFMGSSRLSAGAMEKVLGAIVIVAIGFLGAKILSL